MLISDYGYGVPRRSSLTIIRHVHQSMEFRLPWILVIALFLYAGVTAATPNEFELEEALGTQIGNDNARLLAAGKAVMQKMKLQSLVITRGKDGMVLFTRQRQTIGDPDSRFR